MENPYRLQSRREVYRSRWLYLREDRILRADGSAGTFGVIEMKPGSSVLAVNERREVYLVKEYKYGVERYSVVGQFEIGTAYSEPAVADVAGGSPALPVLFAGLGKRFR